jgi:hypothetical protein
MPCKLLRAAFASGSILALTTGVSHAADQAVVWTNVVNVTVSGDVLQKTAGCDGCEDAGATSQQELTDGEGYIEFTVGELNTFWVAGLSHGSTDTTLADIDFAFRFNGAGWADVLENGVYQSGGDTPYAPGDVFRIAIIGNKVQYIRNGTPILESQKAPQYPLLLDTSLGTLGATIRNARLGFSDPPPEGGGFIEKAGSFLTRPRFTRSQIEGFLPPGGAKGPFTFPHPYNTEGVRLTNPSDCAGGQDCVWYVGYSYWRNINNHVADPIMLILLGLDRNRGGAGPSLIGYHKLTDQVENFGALFPADSVHSYATGEGWYFSALQPTKLYTFLVGGTELRRYDVITRQFDPIPALDLNGCRRPRICPSNAAYIFQPHSSDDDLVHSATVQDQNFQSLGCVVFDRKRFLFYPTSAGHAYDECHVDKSGRWLIILETKPDGSAINRIVNLAKGRTVTIEDAQGSLGHLDMGHGYAVGADNYNPRANATILVTFPVQSTQRPVGPTVHFNKGWDIAAANHVAHGNAKPGVPAEQQYACGSNASRVADMADEIVCFRLNPNHNSDGSLDVLVVSQVMTDLDAAGGGDDDGDDYEQLPKGNLDITGRYFIWTANMAGDRLDAFLVKVPAQLLTGVPDP